MFKILILLCYGFLSLSQALARVEVRWFSVASLVLEDEETQIFFDPMFTRADVKHWLFLAPLKSDEPLVSQVLAQNHLTKIKALFASHSHYDHVIDAPIIAKLTNGTFYVDENSERIARAYQDPKIKTIRFKNLERIQIGKFLITPIQRVHSPIVRQLNMYWLPGPVPEDFNFSVYDYHVGDTWFYYVEHPNGKILIDQGSEPNLKNLQTFTSTVDVIIQGIANRREDEVILNGYVAHLKPKIFVPTHFDNFLLDFHPAEAVSYLPGIRMDDIMGKFAKKYPEIKLVNPQYGKTIEILK